MFAQKGLPLINLKYHQNLCPLVRTALAILLKVHLRSQDQYSEIERHRKETRQLYRDNNIPGLATVVCFLLKRKHVTPPVGTSSTVALQTLFFVYLHPSSNTCRMRSSYYRWLRSTTYPRGQGSSSEVKHIFSPCKMKKFTLKTSQNKKMKYYPRKNHRESR